MTARPLLSDLVADAAARCGSSSFERSHLDPLGGVVLEQPVDDRAVG